MPTEDMQYCRTVLFCATADQSTYEGREACRQRPHGIVSGGSVDSDARNAAKACLQDGNC